LSHDTLIETKGGVMAFRTEQEAFWAGQFGTDYMTRNDGSAPLASNLSFFAHILRRASRIRSCIEFGASIGLNLRALKLLFPEMIQTGIEINPDAARVLAGHIGASQVFAGSVFDYQVAEPADLALVMGLLIHINPDMLPATYQKLYEASSRWILLCEYYNPTPVAISYRKHSDCLFKRDFAGEMLDTFPDLELIDYGFVYRRDPIFPQDDINWFLLEKTRAG
jgi:pseudaminic acid biosynthesis-associated methylase